MLSLIRAFACRLNIIYYMNVKLLTEHHLEFLNLKGVYTCQNATLLEIICHSSYVVGTMWQLFWAPQIMLKVISKKMFIFTQNLLTVVKGNHLKYFYFTTCCVHIDFLYLCAKRLLHIPKACQKQLHDDSLLDYEEKASLQIPHQPLYNVKNWTEWVITIVFINTRFSVWFWCDNCLYRHLSSH